jgi:hypothetical protein
VNHHARYSPFQAANWANLVASPGVGSSIRNNAAAFF